MPTLAATHATTSPEQLSAAAYAAYFESTLRHVALLQNLPLTDASVASTVIPLHAANGGSLSSVALTIRVKGLTQKAGEELVASAHRICPYPQAARGSIDVAFNVQAA